MALKKTKNNSQRYKKEELHRVNKRITATKLRLVGDNIKNGIYSLKEALAIAYNIGLDLVEINSKTDPPICRILEYKKFLYEQKKKKKKYKQEKIITKELRLSPQICEHDTLFKIKHAEKFLKSKEKVKFTIFFKGRSIIHKDKGKILLLKCANYLENFGKIEKMPIMEGKKMFIIITPKKNN
ncbi:MAG: translation initiation factor IF-3 [Candidatus Sulcia muelleri]|uniref:Translation initiation factor IF-3 n=1 Tax=Karelsulcia muelleri (strain GWSS) TaxID=444179 RepID=A8Z5V6_KARMG|nr:translation initiation factor 3 [Candidatus Karelsulcia muelleri GWSS]MBS0018856.1 translation initiation factor IF-3 [Candidatus Karelsulcia muelleri]MCJ7422463.1 translation initiation factor IF-3 [Candidatus Karelsulcia muelleri]MCJ7468799.1 translation initiation factor IF-3 [Candidatus Karelsulcia muelleri]